MKTIFTFLVFLMFLIGVGPVSAQYNIAPDIVNSIAPINGAMGTSLGQLPGVTSVSVVKRGTGGNIALSKTAISGSQGIPMESRMKTGRTSTWQYPAPKFTIDLQGNNLQGKTKGYLAPPVAPDRHQEAQARISAPSVLEKGIFRKNYGASYVSFSGSFG